jgi:hypothetical protein
MHAILRVLLAFASLSTLLAAEAERNDEPSSTQTGSDIIDKESNLWLYCNTTSRCQVSKGGGGGGSCTRAPSGRRLSLSTSMPGCGLPAWVFTLA